MEINRINYEIWLIDYLDGNLDSERLLSLRSFLSENPDIENELRFFEEVKAVPDDSIYPFKSSLTKIAADLTEDQFCYLCIAFAENDLSEAQSDELLEIVAVNHSRKKTFDTINKLKLKPGDLRFPDKKKLKKTISGKIAIRKIVLAGLSIAASATIFFFAMNNFREEKPSAAVSTVKTETLVSKKTIENETEAPVALPLQSENTNREIKEQNEQTGKVLQAASIPAEVDEKKNLALPYTAVEQLAVPGISYFSSFSLSTPLPGVSLISTGNPKVYTVPAEESRGLKDYLTTLLRKTVLKNEIPPTGTIKGYEIADAGINGLNMILGWDMSLEKMKDEEGNLNAFVFSSRLVKLNAPVKKLIAQK